MKKIIWIFVLLLAVITLSAQEITGKWTGSLTVDNGMGQSQTLSVNFNVSATDNGYSSTMDSPDQNVIGYALDTTIYKKPEITFKLAAASFEYVGKQVDDTNIDGTLTQYGQSFDLDLKKEE